jgi:hypothetical protein
MKMTVNATAAQIHTAAAAAHVFADFLDADLDSARQAFVKLADGSAPVHLLTLDHGSDMTRIHYLLLDLADAGVTTNITYAP